MTIAGPAVDRAHRVDPPVHVVGLAAANGSRPVSGSVTENPESSPRLSPALGFVRPTFDQLYRDVRRWLPKDLRRLGVDRLDAEDVLHDVVLFAHRQLDDFDPSAARRHNDPARALRAWIYGIAWRQVDKRHKRASHRDRVAHGTHEAPSVEELAAAGDRRRILIAVLDKLKPLRAEVLILYAVRDMTMPEIARQLGLKENTVKSRDNPRPCRRAPGDPEATA
jgi:RNA polymerase sigma-70 factor (ECF subfamily)